MTLSDVTVFMLSRAVLEGDRMIPPPIGLKPEEAQDLQKAANALGMTWLPKEKAFSFEGDEVDLQTRIWDAVERREVLD